MKNVLLLGATGMAGSALAKKLLADTDCRLTLFARRAGEMYAGTDRITVVNGDAERIEELQVVMPGQDVVYCAISGDALPQIAKNITAAMLAANVERSIFMGAVGIHNEIPDEIDGEDNLDNEPAQLPNRKAADIVKASNLNYTILRPGYLGEGSKSDYVLAVKGEPARGCTTPLPALVKFLAQLILDDTLYARESVSITQDAAKAMS